jgi:hypothetical protein
MWTRSKDQQKPGKFAYSLYSMTNELVETVGGFDTHSEADRAAEAAQRRALFGDKATMTLDEIINSMNDDELLAELLA